MPVWKFGPRKGKGRGYAFATVSNEEEQKKTIDTLNGKEIATGEMFTPRKPATTEENVGEGAEAVSAEPTERILKLVARQGYENEEKDAADAHDEEGAAAGTNGAGKSFIASIYLVLYRFWKRFGMPILTIVCLYYSSLVALQRIGPEDSGTA